MAGYKEIKNHLGNVMFQPVGLFLRNNPTAIWWFPVEPKVKLEAEKIVVRKAVLKSGSVEGTVKELFSTGDYSITIEGVLLARDEKGFSVYPSTDAADFANYVKEEDTIGIVCDLLQDYDIGLMAIVKVEVERNETSFYYKIMGLSDKDIIVTDV